MPTAGSILEPNRASGSGFLAHLYLISAGFWGYAFQTLDITDCHNLRAYQEPLWNEWQLLTLRLPKCSGAGNVADQGFRRCSHIFRKLDIGSFLTLPATTGNNPK